MSYTLLADGVTVYDEFSDTYGTSIFNDAIVMPLEEYNSYTPAQIQEIKDQRFVNWVNLAAGTLVLKITQSTDTASFLNQVITGNQSKATAAVTIITSITNNDLLTLQNIAGEFIVGEQVNITLDYTNAPTIVALLGIIPLPPEPTVS